MEAHLKKATEGYSLDKKFIQPISEMDAEFMSILIDVIEQRGWTDLSDIMHEYKKVSDADVIDRLSEYSIAIDDTFEEEDQPDKNFKSTKREFVSIKEYTFRTFALFTFRKTNRWIDDIGMVYCLIINESPLPGSAEWYLDTIIDFEDESERDKAWESLKNKMKKQNCEFL